MASSNTDIIDDLVALVSKVHAQKSVRMSIKHTLLIAGFIEESELVAFVDERMPKMNAHKVTHGQALAVLLLCLASGQYKSLSGALEQLESIPISSYLNLQPGITAQDFGRDILVGALDALWSYGTSQFYLEFSSHITKKMMGSKFKPEAVSIDTTSISLYKRVTAKLSPITAAITGQSDSDIEDESLDEDLVVEFASGQTKDRALTPDSAEKLDISDISELLDQPHTPVSVMFGHPKNRRTDLGQLNVGAMVSIPGGIPLAYSLHDGNASDKRTFAQLAREILPEIKKSFDSINTLVGDSALCTKDSFDAVLSQNLHLVTRVTDNLKQAKEIIANFEEYADKFEPIDYTDPQGDKPFGMLIPGKLFGYDVNFLAVDNPKLSQSKEATIRRNAGKEKDKLEKLLKTKYKCIPDAIDAVRKAQAQTKYCTITQLPFEQVCEQRQHEALDKEAKTGKNVKAKLPVNKGGFAYDIEEKNEKAGRPKAGAQKTMVWARAVCSIAVDEDKITQAVKRERRYVLVCTDKQASAAQILKLYKGNQYIESYWSLLKNKRLTISGCHFHRTDRIESLISLVNISLLGYRLMEHRVREAVDEGVLSIPTQDRKGYEAKPTLQRIINYLSRLDIDVYENLSTGEINIDGCPNTVIRLAVILGQSWLNLLLPQRHRPFSLSSWSQESMKDLSFFKSK